jgi:hypothetical protein
MGIIAASRLRAGASTLFNDSEGYYKCDGTTSGVLLDSKNSFNGIVNGGITQGVTGKILNAVESDGSNQSYLSIPSSTFNENNFSVSFWMYYSSTFSFNRIILRESGGLVININDKFKVTYFGDNSGSLEDDSDLILDQFNQVIVEKLNDNIKIYSNNVLKLNGSKNYTNTINDAGDLTFGIILNNAGIPADNNSSSFIMDEIDIRKEQYTQQQRNELYNNGNGTTI